MFRNLTIGIALLLVLSATGFAQEVDQKYADKIILLDDEGEIQPVDRVRVVSATYEAKGVEYELRGGRVKNQKDGSRILDITYADAPRVYLEGLQNLSRGQFEKAASDFDGAKNAVDAGKCREWLTEHAAVRRAQALTAIGRKEKARLSGAVAELKKAIKANPKSLLFDEIQLGLVEIYTLQEKWDDARTAAQNLVNVGKTIKHPIWQAKGQQALAKLLVDRKQFAEAVSSFGDLVSLAGREGKYEKSEIRKKLLTTLETTAAVEQGWALVAWAETSDRDADWEKARQHFTGLKSQYAGSDLVAAAVLNGIGRTLMKEDPRAAYMKFVEAEVTYFNARSEVARALWLKAQALRKIGGARSIQRAEIALKELREFYPESPWASK